MSVGTLSKRLVALGLQPAASTLAREGAERRQAVRTEVQLARRRAHFLERKAGRLPLNSNGRRKAEATARQLRQVADEMAAGVEA